MSAVLIAHELACIALIVTVFCRFVRSDAETSTDVRAVFWLLGIVACLGVPAPLVWGFRPCWWTVAVLASMVAVQAVTAAHWHHGAPRNFQLHGGAK